MLRIGLVGFGKWAKNYIRTTESSGIARITTLLLRPDSIKWDDPETKSFMCTSDIESLHVDAAIVAIHPSQNVEICCRLLERKIPVLVEKPIALKIEDAVKIESTAIEANVQFMVNHQHLYSDAYQQIYSQLKEEEIHFINSRAGNIGPYRDFSALWDYAPHEIAMISGLNKSKIYLDYAENTLGLDGSGHKFILSTENKKISSTHVWNNSNPKTRLFEVNTSNKKFIYDDVMNEGKLTLNGENLILENNLPLTNSVNFFLRAIKNNKPLNELSGFVNVNNVEMIELINQIENYKL